MLFADRLEVWNPGNLPSALTLQKLREPHGSFPANPLLAEPLYLAKYIERMGTGTGDMIRLCRDAGLIEPEYAIRDGFVQTLWRPPPQETEAAPQVTAQDKGLEIRALEQLALCLGVPTEQVTTQLTTQVAKVLRTALDPAPREKLQEAMGLQNREHFRQTYLGPLLTSGLLERTIPDKPTSRLQKYRLTEKGRAWLDVWKPEEKK